MLLPDSTFVVFLVHASISVLTMLAPSYQWKYSNALPDSTLYMPPFPSSQNSQVLH